MRLIGRRRRESMLRDGSLAGLTRTLHPGEPLSCLPGWEVIATPGHTPGHVSYFRPADHVLPSGDALVTAELNSVPGLLRRRTGLSGPPWYTTRDTAEAAASVRRLAELNPPSSPAAMHPAHQSRDRRPYPAVRPAARGMIRSLFALFLIGTGSLTRLSGWYGPRPTASPRGRHGDL
jgi:glyoxylase-like metal-dependent hydrolase (beta-lactamase superfamily II)